MREPLPFSRNNHARSLAKAYVRSLGERIPDHAVSNLGHGTKEDLVLARLIDNPESSVKSVLTKEQAENALAYGELIPECMCFRPIDDLQGPLTGGEFLMRRLDPEHGIGGINHVYDGLKANGRHSEAYMQVIEQACSVAGEMPPTFTASVNLAGSMMMRKDFVPRVEEAITNSKIQPYNLSVELIEYIEFLTGTYIEKLKQLTTLGVQLSIDDYGAGNSEFLFEQCKDNGLPVSTMKVSSAISTMQRGELERECTDMLEVIQGTAVKEFIFEGSAEAYLFPETLDNLHWVRDRLRSMMPWKIEGPVYSKA